MSKVIRLKLKRVKREQKWARSCVFGCPDFPLAMVKEVSDDEIFFCQLNLEEVTRVYNSPLLPNRGMLYFFIGQSDYRAIVRFSEESRYDERSFARVDFNDSIETPFDFLGEYRIRMAKSSEAKGCLLLDEERKSGEMLPDEIVLLQYDQRLGPRILETDGIICFVIDREALLNRDYNAVRLLIVRDDIALPL